MTLFWYVGYHRLRKSLIYSYCVDRTVIEHDIDIVYINTTHPSLRLYKLTKICLEEILMMLRSNMSISEIFKHIGNGETEISGICANVAESLDNGDTLGIAIKQHFTPIDKVLGALLSLGENKEHIANLFTNGLKYIQYKVDLVNGIRSALCYPLFVITILTLALWSQVCILKTLPIWVAISMTIVLSLMILLFIYSDKLYLGKEHYRACYFYSIASMLDSGLSLQTTIALVRDSFEGKELENLEFTILNGGSFSHAIPELHTTVKGILSSGEKCGNLAEACQCSADFYMGRIQSKLNYITTLAGPILITMTGLALTLVALYTASYQCIAFI